MRGAAELQGLRPEGMIAGIDEAGRGPLAGPVFAAAVILDDDNPVEGLADSKQLPRARREQLAAQIRRHSVAWSVAWSDAGEIDALNILNATMLAMRRALLGLRIAPSFVDVDGNRLPVLHWGGQPVPGTATVGGDRKVPAISAASILAKVHRDSFMEAVDARYPEYGFSRHKGYGTAEHRDRLSEYGPCPQHRRSFRPVSTMLERSPR